MAATIAVSGTSSGSTPSATPSSTCGVNLYDIPISEPGCAVASNSAHQDAMEACCKSADVISYYDNCGLYCVAADQTIKELQDCLFGEKVAYNAVFCNAPNNATATNTDPEIPATASASVVSGGDDHDDDGNDSDGDDSDNNDGPKPSDTDSAAPRLAPEMSISKTGLTIGALLFSAMAFGAFQI
ncbi:hypothetical protein F5B22DRAFT_615702 [Xylaria bambusicola]|uniref:uncharacterized protein n=1 Tax=Xylaria bambusicola TaxID=326684 RepID=UPI002007D978|nr:uncharacterized protein F5B22DRAFT_615702 [Xylaria bambusicola]KAI0509706.1 hypothetical protein F5B22DRAFT_615702 [Xylaria bambusicola]